MHWHQQREQISFDFFLFVLCAEVLKQKWIIFAQFDSESKKKEKKKRLKSAKRTLLLRIVSQDLLVLTGNLQILKDAF